MEADRDTIVKAVKLIAKAFRENEIPKLEGGIAILSMLNQLKEEGLIITSEPNFQS